MDEKEIKEKAERYCELLILYDNLLQTLEAVTKRISGTRGELVFLEKLLQENGVKIKDVEIKE